MKRVFFESYRSLVDSQARRTRFEVYFTTREGEKYVWTPDWKGGIRQLFLEAYDVYEGQQPAEKKPGKTVTVQVEVEEKPEADAINFKQLGYKLGEMLKNKSTEHQIEEVADNIFGFKAEFHPNSNISSVTSQTIYDWVVTLGEQLISPETKLKLLKQFIGTLAPADSPLKKLAEPVKSS